MTAVLSHRPSELPADIERPKVLLNERTWNPDTLTKMPALEMARQITLKGNERASMCMYVRAMKWDARHTDQQAHMKP